MSRWLSFSDFGPIQLRVAMHMLMEPFLQQTEQLNVLGHAVHSFVLLDMKRKPDLDLTAMALVVGRHHGWKVT